MKRYIHNSTNTYPIEPVFEADDDDNNPTTWAVTIFDRNDDEHYIWIVRYDDEYVVEDSDGHNLVKGHRTYKTLNSAKKKAFEIAEKQELYNIFTD